MYLGAPRTGVSIPIAERASYYGCTGLFTNFVQRPLPQGGNGAGAVPKNSNLSAGALGLGLTTATAVVQSFNFLSFTLPVSPTSFTNWLHLSDASFDVDSRRSNRRRQAGKGW